MRQLVGILGVPVDVLDNVGVIDRLEQFITERRFHQVATANTDFLINALEDPELMHILREADLVIPDGMPLIWASRWLRAPLPERVTGADLVPSLAKLAAERGYRIFMLGAKPEVAKKARDKMEADNPGLEIVGCYSPPLASLLEMDNKPILQQIHEAKPDILLVAFGNPKQEKWIYLNREELQEVPICIGIGGTFDFIAGNIVRAPEWMQRSGLEWLFRLGQEPKRLWKRYTRDVLQFVLHFSGQWLASRRFDKNGTLDINQSTEAKSLVLHISGELNRNTMPDFQQALEEAISSGQDVIIDLAGITGMDGEAIGTFLNLPKRALYRGVDVRLAAAPKFILNQFKKSKLKGGLYKVAPSVREAANTEETLGMSCVAWVGRWSAVLELQGIADKASSHAMEAICQNLITANKRVEVDATLLEVADTLLLSTLLRLTGKIVRQEDAPIRIIPGKALGRLIQQQKVGDRLVITHAPSPLPDAREMVPMRTAENNWQLVPADETQADSNTTKEPALPS